MTTPTDRHAATWAAWKAEAVLLADIYQATCVAYALDSTDVRRDKSNAARAALAAHLDSLPMPRPIAHLRRTIDGSRWLDIPTPVLHGLPDVDVPLYRHPKESA